MGVTEFGDLHKNFTQINREKRMCEPVILDKIGKLVFYMAAHGAKM